MAAVRVFGQFLDKRRAERNLEVGGEQQEGVEHVGKLVAHAIVLFDQSLGQLITGLPLHQAEQLRRLDAE